MRSTRPGAADTMRVHAHRQDPSVSDATTGRRGPAAPDAVAGAGPSCAELIERCFDERWTDGLPVVPPDEDVVGRFLAAARWDADEVLLFEPVRGVSVYAGAVA